MTGRENALHAIMHDGRAEYIPSMADFGSDRFRAGDMDLGPG